MTKSLTEKWKDGELPEDCYYVLTKNGQIKKDRTCFYSHTDEQCFCFIPNKDIKEVLEPVPSYEKNKENIVKRAFWFDKFKDIEYKYKRLQEQLEDANKLIKAYATPIEILRKTEGDFIITETKLCYDPIKSQEYLEKWGVK